MESNTHATQKNPHNTQASGSCAEWKGIFIRCYCINTYSIWPASQLHKWSCLKIQTCGRMQAAAHTEGWGHAATSSASTSLLRLPPGTEGFAAKRFPYLQEQKTYPGFTRKNWRQVPKQRGAQQHKL